jgi:uncharacterized membrane protein
MNTIKSILSFLLLIITAVIVYFVLIKFGEYQTTQIMAIALGILSLLIFVAGKKINFPKLLMFLYLTLFFAMLLSVFVSMWEKADAPFGWIFYIIYGVVVVYLSVKLFFRNRKQQIVENNSDIKKMEMLPKGEMQLETEEQEIEREDKNETRNGEVESRKVETKLKLL